MTPRTHTELRQWPYGHHQVATTIHRVSEDGSEQVELSGVYERLHLSVEPDRGSEMVLPERARGDHR